MESPAKQKPSREFLGEVSIKVGSRVMDILLTCLREIEQCENGFKPNIKVRQIKTLVKLKD